MTTTTSIHVSGMTCDHCARAVAEELSRIDGVHHVDVDLASGTVALSSAASLDDGAVRDAVAEAGYGVVE